MEYQVEKISIIKNNIQFKDSAYDNTIFESLLS